MVSLLLAYKTIIVTKYATKKIQNYLKPCLLKRTKKSLSNINPKQNLGARGSFDLWLLDEIYLLYFRSVIFDQNCYLIYSTSYSLFGINYPTHVIVFNLNYSKIHVASMPCFEGNFLHLSQMFSYLT
jgi:hypothetical protein